MFPSIKTVIVATVRESKTVLDSGFHVVDSGFQVLDSSLCQWNLDSGFQSFVGFRIPCLSCIPDSKTEDSRFNKRNVALPPSPPVRKFVTSKVSDYSNKLRLGLGRYQLEPIQGAIDLALISKFRSVQ